MSYFPIFALNLYCFVCVHDAASDCDVNAVHAWHKYIKTLTIIIRHPHIWIFDFVKGVLTDNRVNISVRSQSHDQQSCDHVIMCVTALA